MKLHIETKLPFNSDRAWSLFESPEFDSRLEVAANMKCELLEEKTEGELIVRRLRYTSKTDLPTMVAKALGTKRLTYVQTNRFSREASRLDWTVEMPMLTDRVDVAGSTVIIDSPNGCTRTVDGEINVRIRFVGGTIERVVVGEFEKSMGKAIELVRDLHRESADA